MKKLNSKCFLLLLLTFFSVGIQAQYSENEALNDWITNALAQNYDSFLYANDHGGFTGTDWTGTTSSLSGDGSSEANMVYNSNGTIASLYPGYKLQGPYTNGTNAFGVSRTFLGNAYTLAPNSGTSLGTITLQAVYSYTLPSGAVVSDYSFSGSGILGGVGGTGGTGQTSPTSVSAGSNTTINNLVNNQLTAILKAAGITIATINPITRAAVIARTVVAYGIITALSDNTCNGTPGGCQSWLNSNYIGPTTSENTATEQLAKGIMPVDMVDRAAFNHDVAYDNLGAAGATSALFDLNTLPADTALLAACYDAVDMYNDGSIDPITGEPVSLETEERALMIIEAFEIIVTEKELRN